MKKLRKALVVALATTILGSSMVPAYAATYTFTVPYSNLQTSLIQQLAALGIRANVTTSTTPAPAPAPAPTPAPTSDSALLSAPVTAEEQQMLNLINKERAANKLAPLQMDMRLVKVARMKSLDMIKNNYFGHTSPTYGTPFAMMKAQGITYKYAGENIAGAATVARAHTILMNSPSHKANILAPGFSKVGIGVIKGGPYGLMISQEFIGF